MLQSISFTSPIVVKEIIDAHKVIINKGSNQGVKNGDRFLIYNMGEEIIDPSTNKFCGRLEVTKGTGVAIYVRDDETIIESDRKEKSIWTKLCETVKMHPEVMAIAIPLAPLAACGLAVAPVATTAIIAKALFENEDTVTKNGSALMPFNTPQVGDRVKHIE